ncbi:MAG TPA: GH25 family lysozyme [Polyangia bacterium]|jgi:lysozyme|nr:GH25 family lysozyme [Polyangia bacterium]
MTTIAFDPSKPRFADVSHYHPVASFSDYTRATDAKALAFKVTEGSFLDPTTNKHLAGAEQHGLVAIGFEYGLVNVKFFLQNFPPKEGRIPVLDFEGASISIAAAEAWIRTVKGAYGRYPWFYAGREWRERGAPTGTEMENCPFWGARYGKPLEVPRGVGKPVAFQFTDGKDGPEPHQFAGVVGNCDVNMLLVTAQELRDMAGFSTGPTAAPPFPGRNLRFVANEHMKGEDVRAWQERVLDLGWTVVGKIDGDFGRQTDMGTRGFQAASGMFVDGVVGPRTWAAAWAVNA